MTAENPVGATIASEGSRTIKCVVWDLDNTLWLGTLLEGEPISLRPGIVDIIKTLDSRGILQSIASKNDHATAWAQLEAFGLVEYFLYPQVNWNAKTASLQEIARQLNIGIDTLALVDDQEFERAEVAFSLPGTLCIEANAIDHVLAMPEMIPASITKDARNRRRLYQSDLQRKEAEASFVGPQESFLATLQMVFTIALAREDDLQRAEELTLRTHQLNTTGYTYSYDELNAFRQSDKHTLFIASLDDRYGTYGKIGLALLERTTVAWTIKLLLMSCRVMSRGVGAMLLNYIIRLAQEAGVRLYAEFLPTERNRMMLITYTFSGFQEVRREGELVVLEHNLTHIQPFPNYVQLTIEQ